MKRKQEVHHRCRCLDRNFTFAEWCAYLQEHADSGETVFWFGKFQFNIHDICLNPNVSVLFEKSNDLRVRLSTAQSSNGRWSCGYDIVVHGTGSSCGARFVDNQTEGFPTEKEAIYDALLYAQRITEREIKIIQGQGEPDFEEDSKLPGVRRQHSSILPKLKQFLKEIEKFQRLYDPKQLNLFN